MAETFCYIFRPSVAMRDVEETLFLSAVACQALHGEAAVRLEVAYDLDRKNRRCVVCGRTQVGRDLNRLFTGLVSQEFGTDCFTVESIGRPTTPAKPTRSPRAASGKATHLVR